MTAQARRARRPLLLALAGALAVAAPGLAAAQDAAQVQDPLEKVNRKIFILNGVIDQLILRPLALVYSHVLPKPAQKAVHNVVTELGEPVVFANDVLQLKPKRAARTAARFAVNATMGAAGLLDPATSMGLEHRDNGFGNTLARYGVTPGPYVFLPIFGPSTFRDGIGLGVDTYSDPLRYVSFGRHSTPPKTAIIVLGGLDQRANAEGDLVRIRQMGTDPYATLRSLYLQNRESELRGDKPLDIEDLPDFGDPGQEAAPAPAAAPAEGPAESAPSAAPPAAADQPGSQP